MLPTCSRAQAIHLRRVPPSSRRGPCDTRVSVLSFRSYWARSMPLMWDPVQIGAVDRPAALGQTLTADPELATRSPPDAPDARRPRLSIVDGTAADQTIERIRMSPTGMATGRSGANSIEASQASDLVARRAVATGAADRHVRRKRARLRHRGDVEVMGSDGARPSSRRLVFGPSWQFDIRTFTDVRYTCSERRRWGNRTTSPAWQTSSVCSFDSTSVRERTASTCSAGRNSSA